MKIKVIDKQGKEIKEVDFPIKDWEINTDLIAQYVRIYQLNQRQGTAKVKTKSEVRGGGRKPWRQKGTGRARAGSIRSPLWRGGGVIHGPVPKNWNKSLNKKMKKRVFNDSLLIKAKENQLLVVDYLKDSKEISTKDANKFLKNAKLNGKVLIVHDKSDLVNKSFRNIKGVFVRNVDELSAYDLLLADVVVFEGKSVDLVSKKVA